MGNKHLSFFLAGTFLLCTLFFTGCKDDTEDLYEGYGMVDRTDENNYRIQLDNGYVLHPKETHFPAASLKDSMRLSVVYSIVQERDSACDVKVFRALEILTKPVIPYDTSILDSVGNDPIKISESGYWIAHGFLNFEFIYSGAYPSLSVKHMVNLLQHPNQENSLELEFRHNAFSDRRDQLYQGVVSFPISHLVSDFEKPVKIRVKYQDSNTSTRTIELSYK